ncbi:glutathione S-transferase [Auriscalpium vulgare]|uniref:Glutathione S-transferase n=1 Tax=Auriscalpium vulgare TaxID=40419 RepID=A0ACB8RWS7_9AGAM|nr:glutathione S-transferase [Auriscalpium vulgare]
MTLKLFGNLISTNTQRVAVVAREAGVPYELVEVNFLQAENKTPEFVKHNPFGLIPYIRDEDGFELYESRAICRYIAALDRAAGPTLVPTERKADSLFEQAVSSEQSHFDPLATELAKEKIILPRRGFPPSEARISELVKQMRATLAVYDAILEKQKYLAGDDITLADLFHLSYGAVLVQSGLGLIEERPNVHRWWKDISSRPAWLAVQSDYNARFGQ